MSGPYNVLFLCTGNSARSMLAECALRRAGGDRFVSLSAGSQPKAAPHPMTLQVLAELGHDTTSLRSKSWDEFAGPGAPPLHFVFTVCDNARGETCPIWPGQPVTAHWGAEDPAAFDGPEEEQRQLFLRVYRELENRIELFAKLPLETLDPPSLRSRLDAIGQKLPPSDGDG